MPPHEPPHIVSQAVAIVTDVNAGVDREFGFAGPGPARWWRQPSVPLFAQPDAATVQSQLYLDSALAQQLISASQSCEAVRPGELARRLGITALRDGQLVAQDQDFDVLRRRTAACRSDPGEDPGCRQIDQP